MTKLAVPPDLSWELIVVNNNSTDETDAVVLSFEHRLPIKLVQERTPGLSYARNRALHAATGEIILWTDDDVIVARDWISRILDGFDAQAADVVFGPSTPIWQTG